MLIAVLLALLVGLSIVAQNGANAQLAQRSSLWLVLLIGNLAAAGLALLAHLLTRGSGGLWQELSRVPRLVAVPSVCGFIIVAAMPLAIARIGVARAVVLVIACQLLAGLAWDRIFGGQSPTPLRLCGALLVLLGALLVTRG